MSVPTVAVAPLDAPVIVSAAVKSVAPNPAVKVYEIGEVVEIILPTALELPPVIFSPLRKVPTTLLTVNCGAVAAALVSSESNTACNLNTSVRPIEISLSVDLVPYAPVAPVAITLSCLDSCVVFVFGTTLVFNNVAKSFTFASFPKRLLSVIVKVEVPVVVTFVEFSNIISPATAVPLPAVRTDNV